MLSNLQVGFAIVSAVILFLHGLNSFSREIQHVGGDKLRSIMHTLTRNRWRGFGLGALVTALVQSSSATSTLTLTLVQARMVSFRNSLALLFGANVGTTITAWMVAWKLTGIGPVFIVLGAVMGLGFMPHRFQVLGRAVFYFGFIFFALNLIETTLSPITHSPLIVEMFLAADSIPLAIVIGAIGTVLVQSSSVTTGMVILLVQQGLVPFSLAVPVVLGANLGTSSTALIASLSMEIRSKRAAVANLVFNLVGVFIFLPWVGLFTQLVGRITSEPDINIAFAHLIFNVIPSLPFLLALKPFERFIIWLIPERPSSPPDGEVLG